MGGAGIEPASPPYQARASIQAGGPEVSDLGPATAKPRPVPKLMKKSKFWVSKAALAGLVMTRYGTAGGREGGLISEWRRPE